MKIGPEKPSWSELPEDSLEKGKLSEHERLQAINKARELEAKLAKELEPMERIHDTHEAQEFVKQFETPEKQNERKKSPEYQDLQDLLREIDTHFVRYPFLRDIFPKLIAFCEQAKLGKNIFVDAGALLVWTVESLGTTIQFSWDLLADSVRFVFSPLWELRRTREYLQELEKSETSAAV